MYDTADGPLRRRTEFLGRGFDVLRLTMIKPELRALDSHFSRLTSTSTPRSLPTFKTGGKSETFCY